jgi:phthalate 4,5-dioxygenase oxygenase subunit
MTSDAFAQIRHNTDLLTRTGPGTPGGAMLRRYWQPVALEADLADAAPVPLRIMSEDLVLFRDDQGRIGLLGRACPHRCADLSYGRVEDGGLRCIYHGFLFDAEGRCLDQPVLQGGGARRDEMRATAYPCRAAGGAIWAYMGPGAPPEFPNYAPLTAPEAYRWTNRWYAESNYVHANEGSVDPSHTSYLHRYDIDRTGNALKRSAGYFQHDTAPRLSVSDTRFGFRMFAERNAQNPDQKILRVTNFVMPNSCAIGGPETGLGRGGYSMHWHVPIDDETHWRFEFRFHSKRPLDKEELQADTDAEKAPGDRLRRNRRNRYLQDREEMATVSYLGMGPLFPAHDIFVTESQGVFHDQTKEHLVESDIAVVRARRQMLAAIADVEAGRDPLGVVRTAAENDFDDLVVVSEPVPADTDNEEFCDRLTKEGIYALNPLLG